MPFDKTLSLSVQEYLHDCYTLAEGTLSLYRYHLNRLMDDIGNLPIDEVTTAVVRRFMSDLQRQDGGEYSPYYQDQVFRTLNTFFRWCVREGTLPYNPMNGVRRPRVPKRKSPRLTLEEIDRLLNVVKQASYGARNLAIVCLMLDSGLRRGEILELKLRDVDIEAGVTLVFDKKTQTEREVPLGDATCDALQAYLEIRPAAPTAALFVTTGGTALTKNGLQSVMYRLKKQAEIPNLRCHLLRHTFANHYINGGGGLRKLQKILGHSDITTTARIYTDPELRELKEEHARVSPLAQIRRKRDEKRQMGSE